MVSWADQADPLWGMIARSAVTEEMAATVGLAATEERAAEVEEVLVERSVSRRIRSTSGIL